MATPAAALPALTTDDRNDPIGLNAERASSLEGTGTRMNRIGRAVLTRTEILTVEEIEARIEAVTVEDVMQLADEHWQPESMSAAAIGPKGDIIRSAIDTLSTEMASAG